jgi:hypothetical protein
MTARDRGAECEEAGDRIGDNGGGFGTWIDESMLDDTVLMQVDEGPNDRKRGCSRHGTGTRDQKN